MRGAAAQVVHELKTYPWRAGTKRLPLAPKQAIAAQLLPAKLQPDMLVLADRNFYGFKLWQSAVPVVPSWPGGSSPT